MNAVLARTAPEPEPATKRRLRNRRDDSGLTTLEWLLIVAAVAGLAALAVVLVTNVVGGTSEQISGSSARLTAAQVAASAVEEEARLVDGDSKQYDSWAAWDRYYTQRCERIRITYSDAVDSVTANFVEPTPAITFPGTGATHTSTNTAATGFASCTVV